jgi:hypothetical protein
MLVHKIQHDRSQLVSLPLYLDLLACMNAGHASTPQAQQERKSGALQPEVPLDERTGSELKSLAPADDSHTLPPDPPDGPSARATVRVLKVGTGAEREVSRPWHIPTWLDEVCQSGLHDHSPCVLLPWPPQVRWDLEPQCEELLLWDDPTVVDHQPGGLALVGSSLRRHGVLLVVHGLPSDDQRVLDNRGGVTEDEVHSAGDDAVAVELSVCLDVQGILVPIHSTVEEGRHIGLDAESHGLVSLRTSCVLETH